MTSSADFSTSTTCQNNTASTLTGTVSFVRVCSALNDVVITRRSIQYATRLRIGTIRKIPGPLIPTNLPRNRTTARSHWLAILIAIASSATTTIRITPTIIKVNVSIVISSVELPIQ